MILKVVSSNLTIRQHRDTNMINYKDKKYILKNEWLIKNLEKFDFFFLVQLKSSNSNVSIELQKDLSKLNLKIRLMSFKNIKNISFFSQLPIKMKETIFRGKTSLIYSDWNSSFSSELIEKIKTFSITRLFGLYVCGRILNSNSIKTVQSLEVVSLNEWCYFLNQFGGSQTLNNLTFFQSCFSETLKTQHMILLNLLEYKILDENKF